jgi:Lipase (class 3)
MDCGNLRRWILCMDNFDVSRVGRLCAIAYRADEKAIAGYAKLGYVAQPLHGPGDLDEAYLLRRGGAAIVVIRGSDEILDWLRRNFAVVGWRRHVHPGFRAGALILARKLRPLLADVESLEIYGHSKGGAIAALLGPMLHQWRPVIATIGAPRFCGSAYAANYPSQLTRIIHRRDPVAWLPFRFLGYTDCGNVVMMGAAATGLDRLRVGLEYHFEYGSDMRWLRAGWQRD